MHPVRMANTTAVFIPPNTGNIIQAGQGIPSTFVQPDGTVQYVQYVGQQFGSPNHQPQQNAQVGPVEKLLHVETKTLGAIQIMIGVMHIGFASVSLYAFGVLAFLANYPFWGGLFFIISGSLSVNAVKIRSHSSVNCSVGMNITSATVAFVGIIIYIINLAMIQRFNSSYEMSVGKGLSVLLLLLNMLEFCISVTSAHFGCQVACCNNEQATDFIPYTIIGAGPGLTEGNPPLY